LRALAVRVSGGPLRARRCEIQRTNQNHGCERNPHFTRARFNIHRG
jgi:hypothetical protein